MNEIEKFFHCPHCGEEISMLLDPSVSGERYVEDCEVCCGPIEIFYTTENGAIQNFTADAAY